MRHPHPFVRPSKAPDEHYMNNSSQQIKFTVGTVSHQFLWLTEWIQKGLWIDGDCPYIYEPYRRSSFRIVNKGLEACYPESPPVDGKR